MKEIKVWTSKRAAEVFAKKIGGTVVTFVEVKK
jgi:nitrous oxide reductase accessory protein NosL